MPLSCKTCRTYLTAYIHGELTPRARRRVDVHLNGCSACAAEYTRHRRAARDLHSSIGGVGQPSRDQLSAIWTAVQTDLESPFHSKARRHSPLKMSAFIVAMVIVLMLPPLLNRDRVYAQIPDSPTPLLERVTQFISPEALYMRVDATNTARSRRASSETRLIVLVQNVAPTPGATEQP